MPLSAMIAMLFRTKPTSESETKFSSAEKRMKKINLFRKIRGQTNKKKTRQNSNEANFSKW